MNKIDLNDRFWAKVDKDGPVQEHCPDLGKCWQWTASTTDCGRGKIGIGGQGGKTETAPRVSWELANGPIPDGLHVLHRCDYPACVRPDHLELGTHQENMAQMAARGRAKHPGATNPAHGEDHFKAILTDAKVLEIRRSGEPRKALAKRYGVTIACVEAVLHRKTWQHLPPSPEDRCSPSHTGSHRGSSKLTEADIPVIRSLKGVKSIGAIAKDFGVTYPTIQRVFSGRTWKHVA